MESYYPRDLLLGVSPLIFAVDAILPSSDGGGSGGASVDSSSGSSPLFVKFLEALSGRAETGSGGGDAGAPPPPPPPSTPDAAAAALLASSPPPGAGTQRNLSTTSSMGSGLTAISTTSSLLDSTEPPSHRKHLSQSLRSSGASSAMSTIADAAAAAGTGTTTTTFNAHGGSSSFLQNARVIPVSNRHAFPPSKDPSGSKNRAATIFGTANPSALEGILPSGWLEKHAHALPSVVIVVTELNPNSDKEESQQDDHLLETLETVRASLAPKRECRIHLVCLVQPLTATASNTTSNTARDPLTSASHQAERLTAIRTKSKVPPSAFTVLHVPHDVEADVTAISHASGISATAAAAAVASSTSTSAAAAAAVADNEVIAAMTSGAAAAAGAPLRRLHRAVREASMAYYLNQVRRTKRKQSTLTQCQHASDTMVLLPLSARYHFKMAVFYDFQGRPDKSLKYYEDAYVAVQQYYQYVVRCFGGDKKGSGGSGNASSASGSATSTITTTTASSAPFASPRRSLFALRKKAVSNVTDDGVDEVTSAEDEDAAGSGTAANAASSSEDHHEDHAGVEVALNPPPPPVPPDVIYQCQAVADWLNLKLLNAAFASSTTTTTTTAPSPPDPPADAADGTAAAAAAAAVMATSGATTASAVAAAVSASDQWRRHVVLFLRTPPPPSSNPAWQFWTFRARQFMVWAELCELFHRNNPSVGAASKSLGAVGVGGGSDGDVNDSNEADRDVSLRRAALLQTIPWKAYQACVEVAIQLAHVMKMAMTSQQKALTIAATVDASSTRQRFVGGLGQDGIMSLWEEEEAVHHEAVALDLVFRAMALFDKEREEMGSSLASGSSSYGPRQSVRLHYLAGGLLYGMDRPAEAIRHLGMALAQTDMWPSLRGRIVCAMQRCRERMGTGAAQLEANETESANPTVTTTTATATTAVFSSSFSASSSREATLAVLMDSQASNTLTETELQKALQTVFGPNDDDDDSPLSLHWPAEQKFCGPLEADVTFPGRSRATAGDVVPAQVLLQSHLRFSIVLDSMTLFFHTAGPMEVPVLLALTIPPKSSMRLPANVDIPMDATATSTRPTAKSVRPNSAGFGRSGGGLYLARPLVEEEGTGVEGGKPKRQRVVSSRQLEQTGGVPVYCEKITLAFRCLDYAKGRSVQLTVRSSAKAGPRGALTPAVRKVPIDEEAYVASAWSRSAAHSLRSGPASLRVLGPFPRMEIVDVTFLQTQGRALEGAIHRTLLRFCAGAKERCHGLEVKMTYSNDTAWSADEKAHDDDDDDNEEAEGTRTSSLVSRRPVLVKRDTSAKGATTGEGYEVPTGWKPVSGHAEFTEVASLLEPGKAAYWSFDMFRPLSSLPQYGRTAPAAGEGDDPSAVPSASAARTSYKIYVRYTQERLEDVVFQTGGVKTSHHQVSREFDGVLLWRQPIAATVAVVSGIQKANPSGSGHESNHVSLRRLEEDGGGGGGSKNAIAIDGEGIGIRCDVEPEQVSFGLGVEVRGSQLETSVPSFTEGPTKCHLSVISSESAGSKPLAKSRNELTTEGSKFGFLYHVRPQLHSKGDSTQDHPSVSTYLGVFRIQWIPSALRLPAQYEREISIALPSSLQNHGPLPMATPADVKYFGPYCYVERAPFEAELVTFPTAPRVAVPFQVSYRITNKTAMHQKLEVHMSETPSEAATHMPQQQQHLQRGGALEDSSLLVSGLVRGLLRLGPHESKELSYHALATKAGRTPFPPLTVTSQRHRTFVMQNDSPATQRHFYVLP